MRDFHIGIDVGGTKVAYGLYDGQRRRRELSRHAADPQVDAEAFFDRLLAEMDALLVRQGLSRGDLLGVGVGVPSYVRHADGRIIRTANLPRLAEFPARDHLQARLGKEIRVAVGNDAQAAALAEHRHGAGRGFPHMLYCPLSTGLASAIIINGELFRGSYGWSGEGGHMVATPDAGEPCGCGNRGCFVSYCSGAGIMRHVERWIAAAQATIMTTYPGPGEKLTAEHLLRGCRAGDPLALRARDQMAHYLGLWCYNLYAVLNINCFVFGGGLTHFGGLLLDGLCAAFEACHHDGHAVSFKLAELGAECGTLGAMELVRDELRAAARPARD